MEAGGNLDIRYTGEDITVDSSARANDDAYLSFLKPNSLSSYNFSVSNITSTITDDETSSNTAVFLTMMTNTNYAILFDVVAE